MKNRVFKTLIAILLLSFISRAQVTKIIDLSTGVDNISGAPIPTGTPDDTWTYILNGTGGPQPLYIGNGMYDIGNGPTVYPFLCTNTNSRWIAPVINPSGTTLHGPLAFPQFQTSFNFYSCTISQVKLNIKCGVCLSMFSTMNLNGHPLPGINSGVNAASVGSYIIPASYLVQGQNMILLDAAVGTGYNGSAPWGLDLDMNIEISTCAYADLKLTDVGGNEKNVFCLNEDAFVTISGPIPSAYNLLLYENTGSGFGSNPIASTQNITGIPDNLNATRIFKNLNINFNTTSTYKIVVSPNGSCFQNNLAKEFSFQCCNNEPDASFSLYSNSTAALNMQAVSTGGHSWQVYKVDKWTGGIASSEAIYDNSNSNSNIPFYSLDTDGPCYFIKHTVANDCGTACSSQQFCVFGCDEKVCNVSTPQNVFMDGNGIIHWDPVQEAYGYLIQLVPCDPRCCSQGGDAGGPTSASGEINILLTGPENNSYQIDDNSFSQGTPSYDGIPPCYSWNVYARCPDGGLSRPASSQPYCAGNGATSCFGFGRAALVTGLRNYGTNNTSFELFPNPASDIVNITIALMKDESITIEVFNTTGEIVRTYTNIRTNDKKITKELNTQGLSKGVYMVKIQCSNGDMASKKLIIE